MRFFRRGGVERFLRGLESCAGWWWVEKLVLVGKMVFVWKDVVVAGREVEKQLKTPTVWNGR